MNTRDPCDFQNLKQCPEAQYRLRQVLKSIRWTSVTRTAYLASMHVAWTRHRIFKKSSATRKRAHLETPVSKLLWLYSSLCSFGGEKSSGPKKHAFAKGFAILDTCAFARRFIDLYSPRTRCVYSGPSWSVCNVWRLPCEFVASVMALGVCSPRLEACIWYETLTACVWTSFYTCSQNVTNPSFFHVVILWRPVLTLIEVFRMPASIVPLVLLHCNMLEVMQMCSNSCIWPTESSQSDVPNVQSVDLQNPKVSIDGRCIFSDS